MHKVEKLFTILTIFQNLKKNFRLKGKIFSVDYYFMSYQTPKNTNNIFLKSFYNETNET